MTDLAETPDEHTQEWSPNARGCPQNAREPLLGTERGWTCDRPSDCDVEPHGSTPRKPLVNKTRACSPAGSAAGSGTRREPDVGLPGREAGEWRTTDPKQRAKAARVEAAEPVPDDQPSLLDFSGGAA